MRPILPIEVLILVFAAALAVVGLAAWQSARRARPALRTALAALRLAAVLLLFLVALNPGRWKREVRKEEGVWAVMVDRSASMATADVGGRPRWEEACRLAGVLQAAGAPGNTVRIFPFSAGLEEPPAGAGGLAKAHVPDGNGTDLQGAGRSLLGRFSGGSAVLKGVVVLSDGRQTTVGRRSDLALRARSRNAPFYAVPLGGAVPRRDLSLEVARATEVSYVGQTLKLVARAGNHGLGAIRPAVVLQDSQGRRVAERRIDLADGSSTNVAFEITAGARGYHTYTFRTEVWEGERDTANNEAETSLLVLEQPMRVLVIEGTPYWDSKFLVQLLRRQSNMTVRAVYRVTADRFFRIAPEESRFLEPSESPFPDEENALHQCDVLVCGKGIEYFLSPSRIDSLKAFLRERGGSVIFARGKPYSGEFPELEAIEPMEWGLPAAAEFRWQPTAAGEQAGLFGGVLPPAADPVWSALPRMINATRPKRVKAFSTVLMEGVSTEGDRTRAFPAVVSSRYGKGMAVAVNSEGLWQWDFFAATAEARQIYETFWSQLLQWAVTCSEFLPGHDAALRVDPVSALPGEPVRVQVVRRTGGASAAGTLRLQVRRGERPVREIALASMEGDESRGDAVFALDEPGSYCVELAVSGVETPYAVQAALRIRPPPGEQDELSADPAGLAELCEESGGRLVAPDDLKALVQEPAAPAPPEQELRGVWESRWDRLWLAMLVLGILAVEWFLRRRNGLL